MPSGSLHYALGNVIIRNQKFPKVKDYYALIFHQKLFKPFLNDAKLLKRFYKSFVSKYVGRLFVYLQNTWRAGHINLKFGMWSNQTLLFKKLENNFFIWAALLGANIFQIFSQLGSAKIFGLWFRGLCSTGPLNSFSTFPQPGWIATDSYAISSSAAGCFQLVPKYELKVKMQTRKPPNIFIWKNSDMRKWEPRS